MIRSGKGIHEVREGSRQHLEERIADRVPVAQLGSALVQHSEDLLLAPAKSSVLEYVRNTGVIWWISLEADGENIILVISCDMKMLCTCLFMLKMQSCKLQFWDMPDAIQREAVQLLSWVRMTA